MRFQKSFLFRLSLMFVALICLPVTTITLVMAFHLRQSTAENLQQLSQSAVTAAARSLENQLEQCSRVTDNLVLSGEVRAIARAEASTPYDRLMLDRRFEEAVQFFLVQNYEINAASLLTVDGRLYQSGSSDNYWAVLRPHADGFLAAYRENRRDAVTYTGFFVPAIGAPDRELYLPALFRPLYHPYNRTLLGVIVLELDPRIYEHALSFSEEPVFVLDADGRVIYSTEPVLPGTAADTMFGSISDVRSLLRWQDTEYSPALHESVFGFRLLQLRDYNTLTRGIWKAMIPLLTAALLCLFCFISLSLLLSRRMVTPLRQLQGSLRAMENGDLTHTVDIRSQDEVGQLARSFNLMLSRLSHYIETAYQEKLRTLDAEFRALQSQINPHFLYNALESINSLALIEGQEAISEMTCALADMFRYITAQHDPIMTVEQELVHVQNYLTLQNISFNSRIRFHLALEDAVRGHSLPKMCLQPLIENCINHAWSNSREVLHITLSGRCCGSGCTLTVSDDGRGIPPEKLEALRRSLDQPEANPARTSIGLHNIHERLHLYAGGSLTIESVPNAGTTVTLWLPKPSEKGVDRSCTAS